MCLATPLPRQWRARRRGLDWYFGLRGGFSLPKPETLRARHNQQGVRCGRRLAPAALGLRADYREPPPPVNGNSFAPNHNHVPLARAMDARGELQFQVAGLARPGDQRPIARHRLRPEGEWAIAK